jgi:hypothetical protein
VPTETPDPRVTEIEALMAAYEQADTFSGVVLASEEGKCQCKKMRG